MKQVGFKILVNDKGVRDSAREIERLLRGIRGYGKDIKVSFNRQSLRTLESDLRKVEDIGKGFGVGMLDAVRNVGRYKEILVESARLSREIARNLGGVGGVAGVGGGGRVNGGSRAGLSDGVTGRQLLSTFSGFIRGGQSASSTFGALASGIGRIGLVAGLPLAGAAFSVRGLLDAIEKTKAFSAANAELAAVLGTTRASIGDLTEQQIKLGSTMSFTATQIGQAQVELAKLGFSRGEILSATEDVARFAIVTGSSIPAAAESAGAALRSLDLDATEMGRVLSVLGVSTAKSALTFERLKVGISTTFATARTFGLGVEEVTALLGQLANSGLQASVAATATRNILLNLSDESGKLRVALRGIGIDEVKGLDGIVGALNALRKSGIDLAETLELTDKRSVNAFNSFLRNADGLGKLRDSITDVNDQFRIMEEERLNSLQGKVILFTSAWERLVLSFSRSAEVEGFFGSFLDGLSRGFNFISDKLEPQAGEVARKELAAFESLLSIYRDVNLNLGVRERALAKLRIQYADVLKDIDIEKASQAELEGLIKRVRDIYKERYDIDVTNSPLAKGLERERKLTDELIERQNDLNRILKERSEGRRITDTNIEEKRQRIDVSSNELLKEQRRNLAGIENQFRETGTLTVEYFDLLTSYARNPQISGAKSLFSLVNKNLEDFKSGLPDAIDFIKKYNLEVENLGRSDEKIVLPNSEFKNRELIIDSLDAEIKKLEVYQQALIDTNKQGSITYRELIKSISELKDFSDKFAKDNATLVVPDKRGSGGKEKEIFPEGSLLRLKQQVSDAEGLLGRAVDAKVREQLAKRIESLKDQIDVLETEIASYYRKTLKQILEEIQAEGIRVNLETEAIQKDVVKNEKDLAEFRKLNELQLQRQLIEATIKYYEDRGQIDGKYAKDYQEARKRQADIERQIIQQTYRIDAAVLEAFRQSSLRLFAQFAEDKIKENVNLENRIDEIILRAEIDRLDEQLRFRKKTNDLTFEEEKKLQEKISKLRFDAEQKATSVRRGTGFLDDVDRTQAESATTELGIKVLSGGASAKDFEKYYRDVEKIETDANLRILERKKNDAIGVQNELWNELLKVQESGTKEEIKIAQDAYELSVKSREELEKELLEFRLENERKVADDQEKNIKKLLEQISNIASQVGEVFGAIFDLEKTNNQNRKDDELKYLDTVYNARLKAAEGNAEETDRIEKELAAKREVIEKRAAEKRRQIALKEAAVQIALNIIKNLANPFAAAAVALIGAIQLQIIRNTRYAKGGFTKAVGDRDETGYRIAGIVHEEEYVAPKHQIKKYPELFNFLDKDRTKKFAAGGFTSVLKSTGGGGEKTIVVSIDSENMSTFAGIVAKQVADSVMVGGKEGSMEGTKQALESISWERLSRSLSLTLQR